MTKNVNVAYMLADLSVDLKRLKNQMTVMKKKENALKESIGQLTEAFASGSKDIVCTVEVVDNKEVYYQVINGQQTGIDLFSIPVETQLQIQFPDDFNIEPGKVRDYEALEEAS